MSIAQLLRPEAVAVYGASRSLDKFGGRVLHNLMRNGYTGRVVPINRDGGDVQGVPAYTSLAEFGRPVDLAILAVPTSAVLEAARQCADAGVGSIVVIGTGFGELGVQGQTLQDELVAVCQGASMRLLGPNCLGVINLRERAVLTSSISLTVGELPEPGGVAFISQSGAIMVSAFDYARQAGIGLSLCVSLGNQADIELSDILEELADDEQTSAICVYAEGFADVPRLLAVARRLRDRDVPLFIVKAGRTPEGVTAAQSHTASMAGSYEIASTALKEAGVVLASEPLAALGAAGLIARQGRPKARGIAICSGSGGAISIAVDEVVEAGLELAVLSEQTLVALGAHVAAGHTHNPIDLGFRLVSDPVAAARPITSTLCSDSSVGACILLLGSTPFLPSQTLAMAEPVIAAGAILLAVIDSGEIADGARAVIRGLGCPTFTDLDSALRAARLILDEPANVEPGSAAPPELVVSVQAVLEGLSPGYIGEALAKQIVNAAGIRVNPGDVVHTVEDAIIAARRLGFPVVMKLAGELLVHKSAVGGVLLDLRDEQAILAGWLTLTAAAGLAAGATVPVYVQEMVTGGGAELIVGLRADSQFGPVVLIGSGGVLTELIDDVRLATAPISRTRAVRLLRELRIWPMLERQLTRDGIDLSAVVDVIERMGWLAAASDSRLLDLELNPVLVGSRGVIAVDARANVRE